MENPHHVEGKLVNTDLSKTSFVDSFLHQPINVGSFEVALFEVKANMLYFLAKI